MSADAKPNPIPGIPAGVVRNIPLVWVPWTCSCCGKRMPGMVQLVPVGSCMWPERSPLTILVGMRICLN